MAISYTEDWTLLARCRELADALFPEGKDQKRARVICMGCPVRAACLAEALDNRIEWGVWGGMTERERRQLLRQRPDVKSWAAVLDADPEAHRFTVDAHRGEFLAPRPLPRPQKASEAGGGQSVEEPARP